VLLDELLLFRRHSSIQINCDEMDRGAVLAIEMNRTPCQATAANAQFRANFANGSAVPVFNFFNPGRVVVLN
jgi:hypothetical protein